jgi:hypothetical protein
VSILKSSLNIPRKRGQKRIQKRSAFWDITPRNPLKINRRFEETCPLHLHSRRISQARSHREAGRNQSSVPPKRLLKISSSGYEEFALEERTKDYKNE